MKPLKLAVLVLVSTLFLVGCESVVHIPKHTVTFPSASLLVQYDVPEPPLASDEYVELPWDDKESMWVTYTSDLLFIIKKHMADKAGIRLWEDEVKKAVEKINAEGKR